MQGRIFNHENSAAFQQIRVRPRPDKYLYLAGFEAGLAFVAWEAQVLCAQLEPHEARHSRSKADPGKAFEFEQRPGHRSHGITDEQKRCLLARDFTRICHFGLNEEAITRSNHLQRCSRLPIFKTGKG